MRNRPSSFPGSNHAPEALRASPNGGTSGSGRPFAGHHAPARRPTGASLSPWYREPWPWLIMAGPLVVVIASMVTLWLAVKSDDGLVAPDYYKRGLLVNQRLPKVAAPVAKVTTDIAFAGNEILVRAQGSDVTADTLRVTLVHPASGTRQQLTLMQDADGAYSGVAPPGPAGAWTVAFEAAKLPTTVVHRK